MQNANVSEVTLNDTAINQNVYVEIENIVGGEFVLFFDVTEREVDIGLFGGRVERVIRIIL